MHPNNNVTSVQVVVNSLRNNDFATMLLQGVGVLKVFLGIFLIKL